MCIKTLLRRCIVKKGNQEKIKDFQLFHIFSFFSFSFCSGMIVASKKRKNVLFMLINHACCATNRKFILERIQIVCFILFDKNLYFKYLTGSSPSEVDVSGVHFWQDFYHTERRVVLWYSAVGDLLFGWGVIALVIVFF